MVRAAYQRPGLDVHETHLRTDALVFREFLGRHIAQDGQMFGRRPQVLTQSDDVDIMLAEIA